jgi:hypothetical protein
VGIDWSALNKQDKTVWAGCISLLASLRSRIFSFPVFSPKITKIKIYAIVIFTAVLYECKTGSLPLWEGHRKRVFENRVLVRILGPKMDEVTADWRRLRSEELHELYS